MLGQRDAALKAANAREKRMSEAYRMLDGKSKGLQAQLAELKEAGSVTEAQVPSRGPKPCIPLLCF